MIRAQVFKSTVIAAILGGLGLISGTVGASIVERVVAVVGEHPILLSELKRRAAPFARALPGGSQQKAQAQSRLYSDMLGRMIDEQLVQRSATQSQLKVSDAEVEAAIERVAKGNNVSVGQLLTEVERSGVSPNDYRRELRTQLLDAKVMNIRLQGRVRLTEEDLKAEYTRLTVDERRELPVRLAVVRLDLSNRKPARTLADSIVAQARAGADFGSLSQQHSSDAETRDARGELAPVKLEQLPKEIGQLVLALNPGDVSAPVESDGVLVIVKLLERPPSALPAYESVLPQLEQRVQLQKMDAARRSWLDSLRKSTHIEIRL
jgi:peptidyl-prolyl cis-trans isomerase SurA